MAVKPLFFKKVSVGVLAVFFFAQVFSPLAYSEPVLVSGKILEIKQIAKNQFEILLKDSKTGKTVRYIADASTLVQTVLPAEKVQVGQRILVPPRAGRPEALKTRFPFENLSPFVREALGLPRFPAVPAVPNIPQVPSVPQIPKRPEVPGAAGVPSTPKAPGVPNVPEVPKVPTAPTAAGGAGAPAPAPRAETKPEAAPAPQAAEGMEGAPPEGAMPSMGGEEAAPRPPEAEVKEPPKEARSSTIKADALKQPTPTLPAITGSKVLQLAKAAEGIKVELELEAGQKESVTLTAAEKVLQILTVKDLTKDMSVALEVVEEPQGRFVQRVTVT